MADKLTSQRVDVADSEEGMQLFWKNGWTDGNPIVLPTEARVQAFLDAASLPGGDVVGESRERGRVVTNEKVAINSVMAGCLPEYLPVVISCITAVLDPDFHHNHLASQAGPWPLFVVNGPVTRQIGMNNGMYVLGPGNRANSTISRAISLTLGNCLDAKLGGIVRGNFGPSHRNECGFAENEETGWEALHVTRGYDSSESTVTVFSGYAVDHVAVYSLSTPELLAAPMVDALSNGRFHWGPYLVIIPPGHVQVFVKQGWSKADLRAYFIEHCKRSVAGLKRRGRWAELRQKEGTAEELLKLESGDETRMVHLFKDEPEYDGKAFQTYHKEQRGPDVHIVVAGGETGGTQCFMAPYRQTGPIPVTKTIPQLVG